VFCLEFLLFIYCFGICFAAFCYCKTHMGLLVCECVYCVHENKGVVGFQYLCSVWRMIVIFRISLRYKLFQFLLSDLLLCNILSS
jgi:hypothetical protein